MEAIYVIGYSFRDDHIRDMFSDAVLANPTLRIVLVDPFAEDIFRNRLTTDSAGNDSPLRNRVYRIPMLFEEWVRNARWRVESFSLAYQGLSDAIIRKRDFNSGDWHGMLESLVSNDLPFFSSEVLPSVRESGFRASSVLRLAWKKFIYDISLGTSDSAKAGIEEWKETIEWLKKGVEVSISNRNNTACVTLRWNPSSSGHIEGQFISEEVGDWIVMLDEYKSRVSSRVHARLDKLRAFATRVQEAHDFFTREGVELETYLGERGVTDSRGLAVLRSHGHDYSRGGSESDRRALEEKLTLVEKRHCDVCLGEQAVSLLRISLT